MKIDNGLVGKRYPYRLNSNCRMRLLEKGSSNLRDTGEIGEVNWRQQWILLKPFLRMDVVTLAF